MRDAREERNASTLRAYLDACNRGSTAELGRYVHDDVRVDDRPRGLADHRDDLDALRRAFPDFCWTVRHLVVEGDVVAAHLRDTGTHRGSYLGVEPTGRRVSVAEHAVYELREGRIAAVWSTGDDLTLREQLIGDEDAPTAQAV